MIEPRTHRAVDVSPWNSPASYERRRFVKPIPPAMLKRVMREDIELNRADGGQRHPSLAANLVRAFCLAVAVGNIVYFGGQMLRGAL